jgi:hypothetical protein
MARETVNITLGGFDEDAPTSLRLPTLPTVGGIARVKDALDTAITLRKGVPVIGDKGSGKSYALRRALRAFRRAEARRLERDYKYKLRRVVAVRTIRSKSYRDAVAVITKAVTGAQLAEREYGRRTPDDDLCSELITTCVKQRVVAVVIREAEFLSTAALSVLRDLVGGAEDESQEENDDEQGDNGDQGDDGEIADGVGVVLVGAPQLANALTKSTENGRRWIAPVTIPRVTATAVPAIYTEWFPGIREHADRIGEGAWANLITQHVTHGRSITVGELATHAQLYFRRMVRKHKERRYRRETVPFDLGHFQFALAESKGATGNGKGKPNAA